jgi:hypothetical protein
MCSSVAFGIDGAEPSGLVTTTTTTTTTTITRCSFREKGNSLLYAVVFFVK